MKRELEVLRSRLKFKDKVSVCLVSDLTFLAQEIQDVHAMAKSYEQVGVV